MITLVWRRSIEIFKWIFFLGWIYCRIPCHISSNGKDQQETFIHPGFLINGCSTDNFGLQHAWPRWPQWGRRWGHDLNSFTHTDTLTFGSGLIFILLWSRIWSSCLYLVFWTFSSKVKSQFFKSFNLQQIIFWPLHSKKFRMNERGCVTWPFTFQRSHCWMFCQP